MANLSFGHAGQTYYDLARKGRVFTSVSSITAPSAYTATAVVGPLLWNGSNLTGGVQQRHAVILGVTVAIATASTVATGLGLAFGTAQPAAPTSTSSVGVSGCTSPGNPGPVCNIYAAGTVATAANAFLPVAQIGTGAITVDNVEEMYIPVDGLVVIRPGFWCAVTGFSTVSTMVAQLGLIWAEIDA